MRAPKKMLIQRHCLPHFHNLRRSQTVLNGQAFGAEGVTALKAVIDAIPEGTPVVLDNKRGDISTTAEAYVPPLRTRHHPVPRGWTSPLIVW